MRRLLARVLLLGLAAAATAAGPAPEPEFVQAVEFPYYLCPRTLWERELVWLKTIGIRTVEFSIPWNWHEVGPGEYDLAGRTSPRRDLMTFIRLLRKLDMRAWVRPLPPVSGWRNGGAPAEADARSRKEWLKQLSAALVSQTASHGGPVAYVEGRALDIDAGPPPGPLTTLSAVDPAALARSREAIAVTRGSLLWTDVEDALYPAGWSSTGTVLRRGVVSLSGEEGAAMVALRREAALLRNWSPLIGGFKPVPMPKAAAGKLPEGLGAIQLVGPKASVVAVTNTSRQPFDGDLRVLDPDTRKNLVLPAVHVPAGESLWLPVGVTIGPGGLCRECSNFSDAEHIVYATAELLSIEFENGILAMEFAAPQAGEAILQFARQPVGPFLAAGKPLKFDWDEKTLRARLTIPAGQGAGHRVRIGIAIEEPETSAFFNETRRLVIGEKNVVSTMYSSEEVANRSRLRLPEGFTAEAQPKSPNEIDYLVGVPADALHGDFVTLTIEADGMPLGRARPQLLRPVSVRLTEALRLHVGPQTEVAPDPAIALAEPKAGSNVEIGIRNNSSSIRTYHLAAEGEDLDFFPAKSDLSVGPGDERLVSLRVFGADGAAGLKDWRLRIGGAATLEMPFRVLLLPRGRTAVWKADLDGDGSDEWVIESAKTRAVFSAQDGGRWLEFTWKETGTNVLPEQGAFTAAGPVEVRSGSDSLEFTGRGWKRTVRLDGAALEVEQTAALPAGAPWPGRRGSVSLRVERDGERRAVYTLAQ